MKLLKPILTVFALAFALIFVTACSSGGSSDASSGKTTAKARTIDEIKKAVSFESRYLETKNHLAMLTTTVLTKATILNSGTNWHKTLV